jgi:tRNA(adenine34) deaminase
VLYPQRGFYSIRTKLHPKTTVVSGVLEKEAAHLMQDFFASKPKRMSNKHKKSI